MGAVTTTMIAGVLLAQQGQGDVVGSLTEYGDVDGRAIPELLPIAGLDKLHFAAWDPLPDNAYEASLEANVLDARHLQPIEDRLAAITPMPAVFDHQRVTKLRGATNVKDTGSLMDQAEAVIDDINGQFAYAHRLVTISSMSTESHSTLAPVHMTLTDFERGLKESAPEITPSQVYAYASLRAGVPFANGTPNLAAAIPALVELAEREAVPTAGRDYKTGQTFIKTVIAPAIRARMLGLNGWFSTNILGNRDGEVLDEPANFKAKELSKLGVLESILEPERSPNLYGDFSHEVRINYYPPRGDSKEGWDNIDVFGWLGYPMQLKINFLCRDSILAAPLVLDIARFLDVAHRGGRSGVQEWLSFYFKDPETSNRAPAVHDLAQQRAMLDRAVVELAEDVS
jgi:myo-inositol-1-phosphate synthase